MTYLELQNVDYDPMITMQLSPLVGGWFPTISVYLNHSLVFQNRVVTTTTFKQYISQRASLAIQIMVDDGDQPIPSSLFESGIVIDNIWFDQQDVTALVLPHSRSTNHNPAKILIKQTWRFDSGVNFTKWLHHTSGQGWLLDPC